MYYAPHRLYKRIEKEERDDLNRVVADSKRWVFVCECRCDDNTTQHFEDENGRVYIPKYKIVCPRANVSEGDYVMVREGDEECCRKRGEGKVVNAPKCNYLDYMVLYV